MLGNLHVRFGGGGEETQFRCAPCPYLTAGFDLREIFPLSQDLARWDSNRVRKDGRDWSPNCTSPKDAKGHLNDPLVGWDSAKSGWGHRVTAPYVIPLSLLL